MNSSFTNLVVLMRPHQYIKNLFIFLPVFFVGRITDGLLLESAALAFVAFSLCASAVYIVNDYRDRETDRAHPRKQNRPLASGAVSTRTAMLLMAALAASGLALMAAISIDALMVLAMYLVINLAYSFRLKHVAIIDVNIIAIGFVLRLFIGSTVTSVPLSMWIVTMTFLLALFLALAKRRDDVLIYHQTGRKMRPVIDGYNLPMIDSAMTIMAGVVIVAYILYTTSREVVEHFHNDYLYLTTWFVILGILRYLQIALVDGNSGSPTRIALSDRFMQAVIIGWLAGFGWIIYS